MYLQEDDAIAAIFRLIDARSRRCSHLAKCKLSWRVFTGHPRTCLGRSCEFALNTIARAAATMRDTRRSFGRDDNRASAVLERERGRHATLAHISSPARPARMMTAGWLVPKCRLFYEERALRSHLPVKHFGMKR